MECVSILLPIHGIPFPHSGTERPINQTPLHAKAGYGKLRTAPSICINQEMKHDRVPAAMLARWVCSMVPHGWLR